MDAFLLCIYHVNSILMEEEETVTFTEFVDQLAHQLANNTMDAPTQVATKRKRPAERSADGQWVCCHPIIMTCLSPPPPPPAMGSAHIGEHKGPSLLRIQAQRSGGWL